MSKAAEYMSIFEKVGIGSADTLENINKIRRPYIQENNLKN